LGVVDRRRAVALAGHTGDVETARDALHDAAPSVRATALGALDRLGALTVEAWEAAAADVDPAVRRRAAELAGRPEGPSLGTLLDDPDASVVEVAAWACGEQEDVAEPVLRRLVDLTDHHDDALVREAAVAALGALGDEAGLPAILRATRDKATVRRRAVLALAPFEGDDVDAALERARADRDWQVRQAAEDLLGR
jgi:HEAT repeat protein